MDQPDLLAILEHATAAYAWSDGEVFIWGNQAFLALATALERSPEELFDSLRGKPNEVVTAGQSWRPQWRKAPGGSFIELTPQDSQPAPVSTDSLTGLLSRNAIESEMSERFSRRGEKKFALVFVDLDNFKQVNDNAGHLAGDRCLEVVGDRLRRLVRSGDVVGRFGGDEFVVLLGGVADQVTLRPVLDRLRAGFTEPIEGKDWSAEVGLSLGAAFSGDDYASPEAMLAAADRAMYADKRSQAEASADIADSPLFG